MKKKSFVIALAEEGKESLRNMTGSIKELVRDYDALLLAFFGVLFLTLTFTLSLAYIPNKTLRVTFFDVGQGDGILIESPTKTKVLIDGGASRVVVEKIAKRLSFFETSLDFVSPTHADKDHIVGSIEALHQFPVHYASLLHASSATDLDDEYGRAVFGKESLDVTAGDSIDIGGGAKLFALLPRAGEHFSEKETNESSLVFLLTYDGYSFLLTGDLPMERENALIQSGILPQHLTVLKAGHHGSKGSTGSALLSYTNPDYVIVSAGKDNRYGHPSKEMLERVAKTKAKVLSTIQNGDITFEIVDGEVKVGTAR
jgi:competence protein ComEC